MFMFSFGISYVPLYFDTVLFCVLALIMVFKCSLNVFLKIMTFSRGFFSKNRGSVISYVAHNILLAYERFRGL
jgi:uncharacterized membrane protein